jgi:hypothetical protein
VHEAGHALPRAADACPRPRDVELAWVEAVWRGTIYEQQLVCQLLAFRTRDVVLSASRGGRGRWSTSPRCRHTAGVQLHRLSGPRPRSTTRRPRSRASGAVMERLVHRERALTNIKRVAETASVGLLFH